MLEKDFDGIFFSNESDKLGPGSSEAHAKFMEFRSHVTNFTNVTQKFRDQILTDLGQGMRLTTSAGVTATSSAPTIASQRFPVGGHSAAASRSKATP